MHFTMMVALPADESIHAVLDPYSEYNYDRDDKGVYGPDGKFYPDGEGVPYTFYDRYQIGGRRDGYIKGKRGSYPEVPFESDKYKEQYLDIDWKWRGSAFIKKYIKGFGHLKLTKCPETHTYFDLNYLDENGCLDEYPEKREFKLSDDWNDTSYDEEAYKKACKEFMKREAEWYKKIPDDYVIYLIDYHN